MRAALVLVLCSALALLVRDGYPSLAAGLGLYALFCLGWSRAAKPRALRYRAGQWQGLLPGCGWCDIAFRQPVYCFPSLVYLRWRRVGAAGWQSLCLWPDSANPEALRQLRKRLRLGEV